MFEWIVERWVEIIILGAVAVLFMLLFAGAVSDAHTPSAPKTDNGTYIETAELTDGVTCYVARCSGGVAMACLRRPQ